MKKLDGGLIVGVIIWIQQALVHLPYHAEHILLGEAGIVHHNRDHVHLIVQIWKVGDGIHASILQVFLHLGTEPPKVCTLQGHLDCQSGDLVKVCLSR